MSKTDLLLSSAASIDPYEILIDVQGRKFPLVKAATDHYIVPPKLAYKIIAQNLVDFLTKTSDLSEQDMAQYTESLSSRFGIEAIYPLKPGLSYYGVTQDSATDEETWKFAASLGENKELFIVRDDTDRGKEIGMDLVRLETEFNKRVQDTLRAYNVVLNEPLTGPLGNRLNKTLFQGMRGWYVIVDNPDYTAYVPHEETGEVVFNHRHYLRLDASLQAYLAYMDGQLETLSPEDVYEDGNAMERVLQIRDQFKPSIPIVPITLT